MSQLLNSRDKFETYSERYPFDTAHSKAAVTHIAGSAQNLVTIHGSPPLKRRSLKTKK